MRTPAQIKQALLVLRFDRNKRISVAQIARDARCSQKQVADAMRLEASETILRRIDAYLDAGHLHKLTRESALINRIELLKTEMYREFDGARSIPMQDVMRLTLDRQKRLHYAMHMRAKRLLREKVKKETGIDLHFSDGLSYWRCKAKVDARTGKLAEDRNTDRRYRARPVVEGDKL